MSDENIKLEKLSQENALLRCDCAGLRAERDALRELLVELREWFTPYNKEILARIDAALKEKTDA